MYCLKEAVRVNLWRIVAQVKNSTTITAREATEKYRLLVTTRPSNRDANKSQRSDDGATSLANFDLSFIRQEKVAEVLKMVDYRISLRFIETAKTSMSQVNFTDELIMKSSLNETD